MVEFFQTQMGRKFYEHDIPKITKALEAMAKSLETIAEQIKKEDKNSG